LDYFFSILLGILIGSIPTAYLLLKKFKAIDITANGSNNVGAMNSYKVSNSRLIGIIVLLLDLLKGILAVLIVKFIISDQFIFLMLGIIGAVLGHCYSFWIKFKGGRGLAAAAGGAFIISMPILITWIILWIIAFVFRKNIHFANFSATILTAALSFSSSSFLIKYSYLKPNTELEFSLLVSLLMLIILTRHIEPMKQYIHSMNKKEFKP